MKSQIDVTAIGPLFWDLIVLQDLLAAIETLDAINNKPTVIICTILFAICDVNMKLLYVEVIRYKTIEKRFKIISKNSFCVHFTCILKVVTEHEQKRMSNY